jgi:hypothetical protein
MMKATHVIGFGCLLGMSLFSRVQAQEIDFGTYYTSSAELFVERNLSFGPIVLNDTKEVLIGSGDEAVLSIEAIRFLDIFLTITSPTYLFLDGDDACVAATCRVPVTFEFAYNNTNTYLDNTIGNTLFATSTVRIPMLRRMSGPPMPPPTPEVALPSLPLATTFVYIGGEIASTGSEVSGSYSNTVTIEIIYN